MRRLPVGDGGLAVHVLTDIGGSTEKSFVEETEIMAFDLFWDGPHYHYGPRAKNERIFWDKTTVPDTLRWTLDQFKSGKLKSMIERAGYPSIASELDENLIQAVMPKIEKRSWDLVALNNK